MDLAEVLSFKYPNEPWTVKAGQLVGWFEPTMPSPVDLAAWEAEAQAALDAETDRGAKRAQMRADWEGLPAYIKGPFRDKFEAANKLLDEGRDDEAEALIAYADPPSGYDATQLAVFGQTKAAFVAAIQAL